MFRNDRNGRSNLKLLAKMSLQYNRNPPHLFIDFKQAFASVQRDMLWKIMEDLEILNKLIKMTKAYKLRLKRR